MPKKIQPVCVTLFPWLKENVGDVLAGLTGTDYRCLQAAVQVIEAYSYNRTPELARAFGACVEPMQAGYHYLAYHAIAHVMEWGDRADIWMMANLPPLSRIPLCAYGPGGSKR